MPKYIFTFLIFLNSLLFCEDFSRVYVALGASAPDSYSVQVINPSTNEIVGSISLPDDISLRDLGSTPDGTKVVVLYTVYNAGPGF